MELGDLEQRETITARVLDLLLAGKTRAYGKALSTLSKDTRERWHELIKRKPALGLLTFDNMESPYTANADGLIEFLQKVVMPSYKSRRTKLENRAQIREQVIGEALDANRLEGLARYEIHLDRKLERMLSMLMRLQDLRAAPPRDKSVWQNWAIRMRRNGLPPNSQYNPLQLRVFFYKRRDYPRTYPQEHGEHSAPWGEPRQLRRSTGGIRNAVSNRRPRRRAPGTTVIKPPQRFAVR